MTDTASCILFNKKVSCKDKKTDTPPFLGTMPTRSQNKKPDKCGSHRLGLCSIELAVEIERESIVGACFTTMQVSAALSSRHSSALGNLVSRAPSFLVPQRASRLVTMASYEQDLAVAVRAVKLASRLCQAVQRGLLAKETQAKADKSPVTVADYGSQVLVSWALHRELQAEAAFSMVAEEDSEDLQTKEGDVMLERITQLVNETIAGEKLGAPPLSKGDVVAAIDRGRSPGGPTGRHWVLDPIDGTRGFVRGDQYAVALGLLDDGEVVVGVLGCPNLPMGSISKGSLASPGEKVGCLFSARKGAGTFLQSLDGSVPPRKVSVSGEDDTAKATFCESYESAHSMQDLTANIAKILGVTTPPVRIDSQAKYGAMARGDAVIYLRFPHTGYREKIWDHAAGCIVITEAGGEVFDAAGQPLDFSRGRFLDLEAGIIATNTKLKDQVLAAVKAAFQSQQQSSKV